MKSQFRIINDREWWGLEMNTPRGEPIHQHVGYAVTVVVARLHTVEHSGIFMSVMYFVLFFASYFKARYLG